MSRDQPDQEQPPARPAPPAVEDYRQVYEGVALPVLIVDHESWLILAVNEAALAQYGYTREEFVGLPVLAVRPAEGQDDARAVLSAMPAGFWRTTAVEHCRKDGSRFRADVWSRDTVVDGRPVRIATINEVTERVRLQRELQQAQKMEVVGRLAGGVAHDFNNALTAIIGGTDLLMEAIGDDPDARADLDSIREAAHRAASLTRHLLAFSRQQVMHVEVCSLPEIVTRSVKLLERVLEDDIGVGTRIDPDTWPVPVDATQLEQVIMNLAVNAQDAMPGGGSLVLSTANRSVSAGDITENPVLPPGDYAELSLRDTGTGMDEITRARAFEPFFTTKPPPEGTGLGLSMAYGIVRQSGGFIGVDSAPGEGTTFRILLPRADRPSGGERAAPRPAAAPGETTVLVVDDEDAVRRSTCRVLQGLGYVVLPAGSAEEAVAVLRESDRTPDLLVTALSLPEMGGRELAARLQSDDPDLGVLFLSGYTVEDADGARAFDRGRRLLQKPFSVESLTEAVRKALESR